MEPLGKISEYEVELPETESRNNQPYEKKLIQIIQQSKQQEDADNLQIFEYYENLFKNNPKMLWTLFYKHLLDDAIRAGKDYYKIAGRLHTFQDLNIYGISDNGEPIFYDLSRGDQ